MYRRIVKDKKRKEKKGEKRNETKERKLLILNTAVEKNIEGKERERKEKVTPKKMESEKEGKKRPVFVTND